MAEIFTIYVNQYLSRNITGYYNLYYKGYREPGNPDFLNILKNAINKESLFHLEQAKNEVIDIILADIPDIMNNNNWYNCTCICIPRAKALNTYTDEQLFFRDAISSASAKLTGVVDGTDIIIRHTNTRTTHLRAETGRYAKSGPVKGNDGPIPYPGITKDTCDIDENRVLGKDIILIDDIYTVGANIDEDGIQALLDAGANNVIFYAIAYTRRN